MRKIHIVRKYPYLVTTLWRAPTDPQVIQRWTFTEADGRLEGLNLDVGTTFRYVATPKPGWSGILNWVVLEVHEPTQHESAPRTSRLIRGTTAPESLDR